jgi:hypothetical protein
MLSVESDLYVDDPNEFGTMLMSFIAKPGKSGLPPYKEREQAEEAARTLLWLRHPVPLQE